MEKRKTVEQFPAFPQLRLRLRLLSDGVMRR